MENDLFKVLGVNAQKLDDPILNQLTYLALENGVQLGIPWTDDVFDYLFGDPERSALINFEELDVPVAHKEVL